MSRLKRGRKKFDPEGMINKMSVSFDPETKKAILIVLLFVIGALSLLSYFGLAGVAGEWINEKLGMLLGYGKILFPLIMIILGYILLNQAKYDVKFSNYLGLFLFVLSLDGLFHWSVPMEEMLAQASLGLGGGYIGAAIARPLTAMLGDWASLLVMVALLIISILLMFNTSFVKLAEKSEPIRKFFSWLRGLFRRKPSEEQEFQESAPTEEPTHEASQEKVIFETKKIPDAQTEGKKVQPDLGIVVKKVHSKITIPIDLLENKVFKPTSGDIKNNMLIIKKTLENFGIQVEMGEISIGPTVTQYTLKPAEGIKLAKIVALQNDLALSLAAHPIRIEAPIPGKALVGIEVPNQTVARVNLREILEAKEFKMRQSPLTLALGKDVSGKAWTAPLEKMPHLLIAGATGSGKTVCINSIIVGLLYQNSPQDLRFIMVDPKRVELPTYNGIPHLLTPVITETKKTVNALKWTIGEMERRFDVLSKAGKRNIQTYNETAEEKMPYIIFVVDELADLMITSAAEVEAGIIRVAQMARAVGIYLILATQRPSVDVITGLMKANIPARIAFSVASIVDSRTILDCSGAEKLLGRGDMLFLTAELSKPKRIQGVYVSDNEIKRVVDFLKAAGDEPEYDEAVVERQGGISVGGGISGDEDELLPDAKEVVTRAGKASASLLQRRLKVGYARAARLLDLMEEQGIIGPADGAKPREVMIKPEGYTDNGVTIELDEAVAEPVEESEEEFKE